MPSYEESKSLEIYVNTHCFILKETQEYSLSMALEDTHDRPNGRSVYEIQREPTDEILVINCQ